MQLNIERGRKGSQVAVFNLFVNSVDYAYRNPADMKAEVVRQFREHLNDQGFELEGDMIIETQANFARPGLDVSIRAFVRRKK